MELDKDQKLNDLFTKAQNEAPIVSFEEMQESFLSHVESPSMMDSATETSNLFTIKTWTIMITTLITSAIALTYFVHLAEAPAKIETNIGRSESIFPIEISPKELTILDVKDSDLVFDISNLSVYQPEFTKEERTEHVSSPEIVIPQALHREEVITPDTNELVKKYRFPMLTAEEKKMYWKQKSKMLKWLLKRDKKMYAFIPSGYVPNNTDSVKIFPFHMQLTEVTNLEYRTFLFDLLEQGRRDDFLMAKPDQSQWIKTYPEYNQPMMDLYFSHPAYAHYPVNNISREAAELYCVWLSVEVNKILSKKGKPLMNEVRLPLVFEWIFAASGGNDKWAYPWGGPYSRNSKGCYLANFNPEGENPNDDGAMQTASVFSYSPNEFGLYCMSGNVAEMVYYGADKTLPGTKGGSFLSKAQNIQINGMDEYSGIVTPNVSIGFRILIPYGNR